MARTRHNVAHQTAEALGAGEDRAGRSDMVLLARQFVDRDRHLLQIEDLAAQNDAPVRQVVLKIAVTEIELVVRRGHAGRVRVPGQEIEGHRLSQDLAERLGETHQITTLLNGLSASAFTLGQMGIAQELAERELRLAQLSGDRGLLCAAHRRLGENLLFSGEFIKAHKHLERASSYFDDTVAQRLTSLDAIVPSVIEALSCLQLGFADRSRQLISEALLGAKHRKNSFELD